MDFFESDAGQCAAIAKSFLEGALVLNAAQIDKGRILFRPTLALAAHGLELMLKACLHLNGQPPPTKGAAGHDIIALWQNDICEPVRGHIFVNAERVVQEERSNGKYPDIPRDDEVLPLIEEYIIALGKLHRGQPYPLRYPVEKSTVAPRTPFLVKTLWATADDFVKRPRDFEIGYFRGQT